MAGVCSKISIPYFALPNSVPLHGTDSVRWSTLGGDSRSFAEVVRENRSVMVGRGSFSAQKSPGGSGAAGRHPEPRGGEVHRFGREGDFYRHECNFYQGRRSVEQGDFRGGRNYTSFWRPRGRGRNNPQSFPRDSTFDLKENVKQNRRSDESSNQLQDEGKLSEDNIQNVSTKMDTTDKSTSGQEKMEDATFTEKQDQGDKSSSQKAISNTLSCIRCGRFGHKPENCLKPVICERCKKEGHVPKVCDETMPWDCIAPFVGFAAPGQSFHLIQNEGYEESGKESSNCALIRIITGSVTANN